jgi:hypothetical protein
VILRGEPTEPDPSGNLFLTNIHQLYESRDTDWTPQNAVDALVGRKPVKDLAASQRSMLERVKSLKDLVVLNDEAHHVHDEDLAWSQSLLAIHRTGGSRRRTNVKRTVMEVIHEAGKGGVTAVEVVDRAWKRGSAGR